MNIIAIQKRSILLDILFTILTLGLWNIYVQWRQIQDLNEIYRDESRYSFIWLVILVILTFGIYLSYHEYRMTVDLNLQLKNEPNRFEAFLLGIASFIGLWFFVDSYQQSLINIIAAQQLQGNHNE